MYSSRQPQGGQREIRRTKVQKSQAKGWATIKRKKAKVDAARGVEFAKFSREIMVATKLGGADLSANFRLRTAVDKAKAAGLPNDNIKRAIEKASGAANNENFEEIKKLYEGWEIIQYLSYTFEEEHPNVPLHSHASNKIVARKIE